MLRWASSKPRLRLNGTGFFMKGDIVPDGHYSPEETKSMIERGIIALDVSEPAPVTDPVRVSDPAPEHEPAPVTDPVLVSDPAPEKKAKAKRRRKVKS